MVDGSEANFQKMADIVKDKNSVEIRSCDFAKNDEAETLLSCINYFSETCSEVMLVKFSGRQDVVREVGDESSELIVALSYNRGSKYFTAEPVDTFENLISILDKETV